MQDVRLLSDGIKLLIVGQLTVLSFLGCIVLMIKAIAWVVRRFETQPAISPAAEPLPVPAEEDDELAAAIAVTLHHHSKS